MESRKRNSVWDEMQYRHLKHMAESSFKVCWPPLVPACTWKDAGFGMAEKLKETECLSGNQEHLGNIPECCKIFGHVLSLLLWEELVSSSA